MLPPVFSVLPLEYHSATASEFVGSEKRRLPYWNRASFDEAGDTAQLYSAVPFQFLRSSVWPYDGSAVTSPALLPTRKFSCLNF